MTLDQRKDVKTILLRKLQEMIQELEQYNPQKIGCVFDMKVSAAYVGAYLARLMNDPNQYHMGLFKEYLEQYIAEQEQK